MDWQSYFSEHRDRLEDFWGRRNNRPIHRVAFTIFGHPVEMASNEQAVLGAAEFARPLYSLDQEINAPPFQIDLIVRSSPISPGSIPDDLANRIQYSGYGDWLAIHLNSWGHCQVDLSTKRALAVLTPELAGQPSLISRYLLNTILTNFLIASGYGFLHTTALLKDQQVLLLLATHNSGKSTIALRLALAGYRLLSDSMIFIGGTPDKLKLYGFPVGRIKLRSDMVDAFPQLKPYLEAEIVRDEVKFVADLRRYNPNMVHQNHATPADIHLCLLNRTDEAASMIRPATSAEVMESVMANSLFYDKNAIWEQNMSQIMPLVNSAHCYYLAAGTDARGLITMIDRLWH